MKAQSDNIVHGVKWIIQNINFGMIWERVKHCTLLVVI
jgi:hypothetical protein